MRYRKHGLTRLEGIAIFLPIMGDYVLCIDCHDCEKIKDKRKLQVMISHQLLCVHLCTYLGICTGEY